MRERKKIPSALSCQKNEWNTMTMGVNCITKKMCSRLHREKDKYMFGFEIDVEKAFSKQSREELRVYWWKLDAFYVFVYAKMYWCLIFLDIFTNVSVRSFPDIKTFPLAFCFATLWTFSFVLFIKSLQNVAVKASFLIFPREIFFNYFYFLKILLSF